MMPWERIALTGILARLHPKLALEVGVYYGGSMSLLSQYSEHVIGIDIDPSVTSRFTTPPNAELRIGDSRKVIPQLLTEVADAGRQLEFVLIDGDHSGYGVKRDIELLLQYAPVVPMVVLVHDSGNPECRLGIRSVDFLQ